MIDFLAGLALGAFGMIVIALHLGNRAQKPTHKPKGVSAIGMDLNKERGASSRGTTF
jgi:hypothetical protein